MTTYLKTDTVTSNNETNEYICECDGASEEIEATSAQLAAEEYVCAGVWGIVDETVWARVRVRLVTDLDGDDEEVITVPIDPEEPDCTEPEHDWQAPHEIVGGLEENPGVQGHGGGVVCHEACLHCGCARITDTWAQDLETGEQGLRSVSYEEDRYEDEVDAYGVAS